MPIGVLNSPYMSTWSRAGHLGGTEEALCSID